MMRSSSLARLRSPEDEASWAGRIISAGAQNRSERSARKRGGSTREAKRVCRKCEARAE